MCGCGARSPAWKSSQKESRHSKDHHSAVKPSCARRRNNAHCNTEGWWARSRSQRTQSRKRLKVCGCAPRRLARNRVLWRLPQDTTYGAIHSLRQALSDKSVLRRIHAQQFSPRELPLCGSCPTTGIIKFSQHLLSYLLEP